MDDDQVVETRTCRGCAARFDITADDRRFYLARGLVLPARCFACRRFRREQRARARLDDFAQEG
jgi:hypothetical protein